MMSAPSSRYPARLDITEFRLAWRVLILGLFGVCTSMSAALLYGFGTMVIPLQDAFGWSRGELQASITFLFAGVAVASQLLGWLYARFGLRRVAIISIALQVACYAALTQLTGNNHMAVFCLFCHATHLRGHHCHYLDAAHQPLV